MYSLFTGGVDTGWTFTTPLSTHHLNTNVITTAAAIFIAGQLHVCGAEVHRYDLSHALPGNELVPAAVVCLANHAASITMVVATPVLAISLTLVGLERLFGIGVFDPAKGGDPLIFQHLFWFYFHHGIYTMILPGFAVMSGIISTFSRKRAFGNTAVAFSSVGVASLGFFIWGHHMFIFARLLLTDDAGCGAIRNQDL